MCVFTDLWLFLDVYTDICGVSRERCVRNDVRPQHRAFQHHLCWTARQQLDGTSSALRGVGRAHPPGLKVLQVAVRCSRARTFSLEKTELIQSVKRAK